MQFYPERAPYTKHKWGPQPLSNGNRVAACGARAGRILLKGENITLMMSAAT